MGSAAGKWRQRGATIVACLVAAAALLAPTTLAWARVARSGAEIAVRRTFRDGAFGVLQVDPAGGARVRGVGFGRVPEPGERFVVADGAGFVGLWMIDDVALRGCDHARHFEVMGHFLGATPRDAVGERLALGPLSHGAPGRLRTVIDPELATEKGARALMGVDLDDDDDLDVVLLSRPCPAAHGENGACLETRASDDGKEWRVVATLSLHGCP